MPAEGNAGVSKLAVSQQIARAIWGGLRERSTSAHRKMMVLRGFLASGLRLAHATTVGRLGPRPDKPLVLWDFERCSASRSVRETLTGSQKIVRHLYARYGAGPAPRLMITNPMRVLTGLPIRALIADRGGRAQPSQAPENRSSCTRSSPRPTAASRAPRSASSSCRTRCTTWPKARRGATRSSRARSGAGCAKGLPRRTAR